MKGIRLSRRVARTGEPPISYLMTQAVTNPDLISLAAGLVDQPSLPVDIVARAAQAILGTPSRGCAALQYGTTEGDHTLRNLIVEHLANLDAVSPAELGIHAGRIVVGTGSQQLLYLVGETLLDPDDIVLLGVPAYFVYMGALENMGAHIVPIATDESGLITDALDEELGRLNRHGELGRVKMIYDVSYFNNPTGLSLTAERRAKLVQIAKHWSKKQRIVIVEDAAYRELRYNGADLPSLLRFDPEGDTAVYAGTFSKPFSPGMKTGYIVLPADLVGPFVNQKGHHDFGSANFNQQLLAEILAEGAYHSHLAKLVNLYRDKRDAMLGALAEHLAPVADQVDWTKPQGGLYVWVRLPGELATSRGGTLFERCLAAGVLYVPGEHAFPRSQRQVPTNFLRLSFGIGSVERIIEGVRRFASVLVPMLKAPAHRQPASVL